MPDAPKNAWKIVSQSETVERGPDDRLVEGVRVRFSTELGNVGSVFIPRARYNVKDVRAEVAQAAGKIDEIHRLTG